jgi:autoinducer 2-degrading protein
MYIVHVHSHVKPEAIQAFINATLENARNSRQEPGVARFDVLQQKDAPERFLLIEVYLSPDDPAKHKATAHYARWRDAVESMMAEPRQSFKYDMLSPDSAG